MINKIRDIPEIDSQILLNQGTIFFKYDPKTHHILYDHSQFLKIYPYFNRIKKIKSLRDFFKNIHASERKQFKEYLHNISQKNNINLFLDIRFQPKNQQEVAWIRIHTLSYSDIHNDRQNYIYGTIQNITSDKNQLIKTAQIAYTDKLTGLINRERMKQKIALAIGTAEEYKLQHSLIAINIDNLTAINTTFGYQVANDLIEEVAKAILSAKRSTDIIARVSSGKFVILLIDTKGINIVEVGERFLNAVRHKKFITRSGIISITASGAACHIPSDANTNDSIFEAIEQSLTKAKKRGRDNFVIYNADKDKNDAHQENIIIAGHVIKAIQNDDIFTAYQPIIHCENQSDNFLECLARIQDDKGEFIPAYKFISISENIGLVKNIDLKLLENAVNSLRNNPNLKLSVNISGHTLYSIASSPKIFNFLKDHIDITDRLYLELTETIALQDIENLDLVLTDIKKLGYKLALDDFGAGYNSFSNLKDFEFDMVKIDGSYIKGVHQDTKKQIFVETLTNLAKKLNLITVAEMIDNQDDLKFIQKIKIDYYQGYYFAKPEINFEKIYSETYNLNVYDQKIKKVV